MGFPRAPLRAPSPPRARTPVFAVGQRIYVTSPGDGLVRATLTDEHGKTALASLDDGAEVTVLAWRPGVAGYTRYRVRATDTEVEGWLTVGELRSKRIAIAPALGAAPQASSPAPPRVTAFGDSVRRFGQRRQ